MSRRVVITGIGVVAPNGVCAAPFWSALSEGKSGISTIRHFDPTELPTRIAGEITDPLQLALPERVGDHGLEGRPMRYAVHAALEALTQSGWEAGADPDTHRRAVVVGGGCRDNLNDILVSGIVQKNPEAMGKPENLDLDRLAVGLLENDDMDLYAGYAMAALAPGLASMARARQAFTLSTACAGGAQAIHDGMRLIRRGDVDWALVGGVDSLITRQMISGFSQLSALSTRNDAPEAASRPFDKERDGFVMGEGAAFLVIEDEEHARARDAEILAELAGAGISSDAYRLTDPRPDAKGMALAMKRALDDAQVNADGVQYINAHGTSTAANDLAETTAIKQVFDHRAREVAVSSSKSMTGHLIHGAGALEAAVSVLALRSQGVPPTINYEHPDADCDLDYVPNEARDLDLDVVLSNSFGFGGQNTTLAFRRWSFA